MGVTMKYVKVSVICLLVLVVLSGLAQFRLPGSPNANNVLSLFAPEHELDGMSDPWMKWKVRNYGLFCVAYSESLELYFIADPITGCWHPLP
jgi:hypothetical protein